MSAKPSRLPLVVLALTLSACASGPDHAPTRTAASLPGTPGCFWLRSFEGSWTVLNQTQLLVYAPLTSPPYLLQLLQPVTTLKFSQRLGFEDSERTGMICDSRQDDLIVPNYVPHRIPILAVHQVSAEQARALMLANGLKVPHRQGGS